MTNEEALEKIERSVIETCTNELRDLPRWVQDAYKWVNSGKIRETIMEYWHLYRMCEFQVHNNTPDGWDAKINVMPDGEPYCFTRKSIDGLIDTIPAENPDWQHGEFINGYFGYKMIGGCPWRKGRDSGGQVTLRHDSGKTSIAVSSHPDEYKFAMMFAQSLVDDAKSGRLRIVQT